MLLCSFRIFEEIYYIPVSVTAPPTTWTEMKYTVEYYIYIYIYIYIYYILIRLLFYRLQRIGVCVHIALCLYKCRAFINLFSCKYSSLPRTTYTAVFWEIGLLWECRGEANSLHNTYMLTCTVPPIANYKAWPTMNYLIREPITLLTKASMQF